MLYGILNALVLYIIYIASRNRELCNYIYIHDSYLVTLLK